MRPHRHITLLLSGPSGAGKGAITPQFLYYARTFEMVRTYTTREERLNEGTGAEKYKRVSREEFERLIAANHFLEYAEHFGNYYGTPRSVQYAQTDQFLEVDCVGAENLRMLLPGSKSVFITTRDPEELERRLRGRRSGETEDQIRMRLEKARAEVAIAGSYDYWLVNDDIHQTASLLTQLAMLLKFGNDPKPDIFRNQALLRMVKQAFGVTELATA